MKTFLLILLLGPLSTFSQNQGFVKNENLLFNSVKYPTAIIRLSDDSWSNFAMVFVTDEKNFDYIKIRIPKIYYLRKQEYSDYYLIGIKDLATNRYKNEIVKIFLSKIDSNRMAAGLSVFLRNYSIDQSDRKINYHTAEKTLKEVNDLYYLNSKQDICKYMICPK